MIFGQGASLAAVAEAFISHHPHFTKFQDPSTESEQETIGIEDCWFALNQAKNLGWINLNSEIRTGMDSLDLGSFDIDAHAHYSRSLNGRICMLVPGKVIIFPSPADLPDNRLWMDSSDGVRRFSAPFYADLLSSDFGVVLVACIDSADYDRPAFAAHGIATEDLPVDGTSPDLLRAMDRFITIAGAAPGAVALHSGPGPARSLAGALVAAYLVRRLGFSAEAAVAWVRMVHPTLLSSSAGPAAAPGLVSVAAAAASASAAGVAHRRLAFLRSESLSERVLGGGAVAATASAAPWKLTRSASEPERLREPERLHEATDVFDFC